MNRTDVSLLLLRSVFGCFLAWHGVNKVRGGLDGTAGWFASIGMKWPRLQARIAAVTEIGAGLMLAVGFLTPLAGAAVIATMLVAIVTVHWRVGFFVFLPGQGWEYCASIAVAGAAIVIVGPGRASFDYWLGLQADTVTAAAGVALGGLAAAGHLALSWRRTGDPA